MTKKNDLLKGLFILIVIALYYIINYPLISFDYVYRDATIYFPLDHGYDIKYLLYSSPQYQWLWSLARIFGAYLEFIISQFIFTEKDLDLFKNIAFFINISSGAVLFLYLNYFKINFYFKILIVFSIFLLPGFLYINHVSTISSHVTVLLSMLSGYLISVSIIKKKIIQLTIGVLLYTCAITSHTPFSFLILIFPFLYNIYYEGDYKTKVNFNIKFIFFFFISLILFFVLRKFLIDDIYNFLHQDYLEDYKFFKNTHHLYALDLTKLNLNLIFSKIYLLIFYWIPINFNLWNIYTSNTICILIILFILRNLIKNNINKFNKKKILNSFNLKALINIIYYLKSNTLKKLRDIYFYSKNKDILKKNTFLYLNLFYYGIPISLWFLISTTLISHRSLISTTVFFCIFILYYVSKLIKNNYKSYFYIIFLIIISINAFQINFYNAKNNSLEFHFIKNALTKIDEKVSHIHLILPVNNGKGFNNKKSIFEEFNRNSSITWQEYSRFFNMVAKSTKSKYIFTDCYTKIEEKDNYHAIDLQFPYEWDLQKCTKELNENEILLTWSFPFSVYHMNKNLSYYSKYVDMRETSKDEFLNYISWKNTMIVNYNDLYNF